MGKRGGHVKQILPFGPWWLGQQFGTILFNQSGSELW